MKVTAEFVIRIPRGPPWLTIQNCSRTIRKGGELTLYQTKLLQSTLKLEPKRKKHLRCRNRIFIALVSRKKTSGIMKYLNIHSILLYVHPTHIGVVVETQNKKRSLFPLSHPLFFAGGRKKCKSKSVLLQLLLTFQSKTYSYHHLPTFEETRWTEKGLEIRQPRLFWNNRFLFPRHP